MKSKKALLMIIPIFASMSLVACGNPTSTVPAAGTSTPTQSTPTPTTNPSNPTTTTPVTPGTSTTIPTPPPGDIDISSIVDEHGVIKNPVSITLWSTTGQKYQPALQGYVDSFLAKQPNVTVTNTIITGGYSDLRTNIVSGFSTGNYPNIAVAYPDHVADYLDYGKAIDLTQVYNDPIVGLSADDKEDYIAAFMEEGTKYAQEGIYSLPWCKSTELMYYNEDKLLSLDLSDYDSTINGGNALSASYLRNLTWDELFEKLCPAIEEYNADHDNILYDATASDAAIVGYDSDDNFFITLAEQYGYDYTSINQQTGIGSADFNNPEMRALLEKFHGYAAKKYLSTKGLLGGSTYVNTLFTANKSLFSIGSTGGVTHQFSDSNAFRVGAARIPQADPSNGKTILQGPSMTVLNKNSDAEIVASWLLWKELTSEAHALDWSMNTGYMGVRHSVYSSADYVEASDITAYPDASLEHLMANSYVASAAIVDETFTSPVFVGSAACREAVGGLFTQCIVTTSWDLTGTALTEYIKSAFDTAETNAKLALPE